MYAYLPSHVFIYVYILLYIYRYLPKEIAVDTDGSGTAKAPLAMDEALQTS